MIELVREKMPEVEELCRRFNVRELQLFGSAYEGDFDFGKSDLDFIVEMLSEDGKHGTRNYFEFLEALEKTFGRKVDLLEKQAIRNPYFIDAIRNRRETLYAA